LASLPSTLFCDQCGQKKYQGKFPVNQLGRYREKARCWDCTGNPVADPRFAGLHEYCEEPDTLMPPRRLPIEEEQKAAPLFKIVRLNGIRKSKQTINVARLVPYRRSACAALPQPAAAKLESKEERQAPLFVATPSPAEIAALDNPPLSLGISPAAILNYQLQKFRDRLGIPAEVSEPTYISIQDRELRLRDLATLTSRAVEYNRYYDSLLLARNYPGESPLHASSDTLSVIALAPLSIGPASTGPAIAYADLQSY
jgi:hypothetical protein